MTVYSMTAGRCRVCDKFLSTPDANYVGARAGLLAEQSICKACYSSAINLQRIAHTATARRVKIGVIPKAKTMTCVDCGAQAFAYDHRSYARPIDIEPVCRSCNTRRGPAIEWGRRKASA